MNHILTLILLIAADTNPANTDLTVHEWGTFTSVAGKDGSAVDWDTLGCSDDLPDFVHSEGYRNWRPRGHRQTRRDPHGKRGCRAPSAWRHP